MAVSPRVRGRQSKKVGEAAELVIAGRMKALGIRDVENIATPWTVVRRGSQIVNAYPKGKVSADWRGVFPLAVPGFSRELGLSIKLECKKRDQIDKDGRQRSLRASDFEPHQPYALDQHDEDGGISLVGWVGNGGIAVVPWRECGIKKGHGLRWEDAQAMALERPQALVDYATARFR